MQFFKAPGGVLHFRAIGCDGNRPVIAFVNSLGTDFRIWDAVIDAFGDRFGYLLHDKRGHGLSDLAVPPYRIDDHVDDLEALLDHLQLSAVVVVGLSVGGLIAQRLFERRPDLVRALVLSNTAHRIGTVESWGDRIAAVERDGLAGLVDPVMERWFTPNFRQVDNLLYGACRSMLARQPANGYAGTCAALRDADFTAAVSRISVPTLCVAGDQDGATPPALVRSMAALIPGSRFEIIDDCGHIPCIEQPAAYAACILAFLNSL